MMSDEQQSNQSDHFGRLNFHPAYLRQEIRAWLLDPAGLPLVLQGEHGIGREYCLRAACFNQELHQLPWIVKSVDLFHKDRSNLKEQAAYLTEQLKKQKNGTDWLALLAEAFPSFEKGPAAGAAIALNLVFNVPGTIKLARALLSAWQIPTESLPDNNPSNALRRLLERILVDCNLILHFRNADQVDMGTANLFLTLGDLLDRSFLAKQKRDCPNKQQGRLLLAFACSANARPMEILGRRREQLKILSVEGLTIEQLRQCMQSNFVPNRFSEELLSALHFSGRAKEEEQLCAPVSIARAVHELLEKNVLIWEKDCWIINPNVDEEDINTVIGPPLLKLYRERLAGIAPELRPLAERFMVLAGLCRQWIPQQLLLAYMGLDDETGDCLLDSLEAAFVDQQPALLIDEEWRYPGFTKNAIYRFTFPLLAVSLRPRKGSKEPEKLLAFLEKQPLANDRATAALCWQLAEQAESNVQEQWREKLAWFFAPELAEQFADMLLAKLQAGLLAPGALLEKAEKEREQRPILFLQAIISACDRWYQAQGGVPNNQDGASFLSLFGVLLYKRGDYKEALVKHQVALAMWQHILPKDHPNIANSFNNIGLMLQYLGRYEDALEKHEKALAMRQRVLPKYHPDIASSLNNIGLVLNKLDRHEDALAKYEAALASINCILPKDHPSIAAVLNNIGTLLNDLGRYEEALAKHEAALVIKRRVRSKDPSGIASILNNIGLVLNKLGRYEEALAKHQEALDIDQRVRSKDHPHIATDLNNIGLVLNELGRHEEALANHEAALAMRQRMLSEDHPDIAGSFNNIGAVLNKLGRYEEALANHEAALAMRQRVWPEDHPDIAMSLGHIGAVLENLGRYEEALANHQAALAMRQRILPEDHPDIAKTHQHIQECQEMLAKHK